MTTTFEKVDDRAALAGAVVLAAVAALAVVAWARFSDRLPSTHNTIDVVLLGGVVVVAFGLLTYRPSRRSRARNVALTGAMVVAIVGLAQVPTRVGVDVRDQEAVLVDLADRVVARHAGDPVPCGLPPAELNIDGIGHIEDVCVYGSGANASVEFSHQEPEHADGVGYALGRDYRPPSTCIKHLYGPWWQFHRPADPDCPAGIAFVPGG